MKASGAARDSCLIDARLAAREQSPQIIERAGKCRLNRCKEVVALCCVVFVPMHFVDYSIVQARLCHWIVRKSGYFFLTMAC